MAEPTRINPWQELNSPQAIENYAWDKIKVKISTKDQSQRTNSVAILWCGNMAGEVARYSGIIYKELIKDPTQRVKGFELSRQEWTNLNQIRIGHNVGIWCTSEN